jgi:CheY-like chemotaxis protein
VLSYGSLLSSSLPAGSEQREHVDNIDIAGRRAAALTRQLLAFGRKDVVERKRVCLNAVVAAFHRMLHRAVREDIEIRTHLAGDLDDIEADESQMEQVLMNLVVNARDAMPHGGVLTITTENVDVRADSPLRTEGIAPGAYVTLSVADTGVGIDDATRTRIFEPFFSTKAAEKGTGLGLFTSLQIVKESHGHVLVDSETGRGTTFRVVLPSAVGRRLGELDRREPDGRPVGGTETLLLVEDEVQVRALMRTILGRAGYRVVEASNPQSALEIAARLTDRIDLLVTDVIMPKMSGRQLAERLSEAFPGLKVLYVSGYTDGALDHHGVLDSDIDLVRKPITPDVLLRRVRRALDAADIV